MALAIQVKNVSKLYRLGEVGTGSLAHDINRWWHRLRGKDDPYSKVGEANDRTIASRSNYSWALNDINIDINEGEVTGIIGRNGAGKSTLLKLLSRVTTPTTGSIHVRGRIASLLEVGTGFHPELSGRENVFLNGAILGMRKKEIQSKLDQIIAFSGCERYIDTPVKRYSSGMTVRLGFAVAAHLECETLIVDEVLAVGDADFQKKCLGKIKEISDGEGRTILIVSHNMASIQRLCNSAVVLNNGTVKYQGGVNDAVKEYLATAQLTDSGHTISLVDAPRGTWASPVISSARILNSRCEPTSSFPLGDDIIVEMQFDATNYGALRSPVMGVVLRNSLGDTLGGVNTRVTSWRYGGNAINHGIFQCKIKSLPLIQGEYSLDLWLGDGEENIDCVESALSFTFQSTDIYKSGTPPLSHLGSIIIYPEWHLSKTE